MKNAQKALFRATREEQTVSTAGLSRRSAARASFRRFLANKARPGGADLSVPGTMHFGVLAVGERVDEPEGVLRGAGVEFVQEHRIGGAFFPRKFQLGIAENYFAFVGDAEFGSDL